MAGSGAVVQSSPAEACAKSSTTSSSARARQGACWPTASPPTRAVDGTADRGRRRRRQPLVRHARRVTRSCWAIPRPRGTTPPAPSGRAGRSSIGCGQVCSAGRARSTAWSTTAASAPTTTRSSGSATRAGAGTTCSRSLQAHRGQRARRLRCARRGRAAADLARRERRPVARGRARRRKRSSAGSGRATSTRPTWNGSATRWPRSATAGCCSAADAFLHPVMDRPNLTVATRTDRRPGAARGRAGSSACFGRGASRPQPRREVLLAAGRDRHAEAADALRHRACRRPAGGRRRCRGRQPERRRAPARAPRLRAAVPAPRNPSATIALLGTELSRSGNTGRPGKARSRHHR